MVKGISRQVIVVHSPEPKLFEQAIFILKDDVAQQGVTDEQLLKEARQAVCMPGKIKNLPGMLWACGGAGLTGLVWLLSSLL